MKMKLGQMLLSILSLALLISASRADDIPQRPNFGRYDAMLEHSPFAVATAIVMPAATPNFAKDLYVANAAHADTVDLVTVISASDKNLREYLTTEGPNDHGYAIANIQWSEQKGETKVTISKDGQFATIGFNESLVSQPTAHAPTVVPTPVIAPPPPYQNPMQPNIPKPPQYPTVATPTPHTRPVIQRNPRSAAGPRAPLPPENLAPVQQPQE
jgi:hypothetical protein